MWWWRVTIMILYWWIRFHKMQKLVQIIALLRLLSLLWPNSVSSEKSHVPPSARIRKKGNFSFRSRSLWDIFYTTYKFLFFFIFLLYNANSPELSMGSPKNYVFLFSWINASPYFFTISMRLISLAFIPKKLYMGAMGVGSIQSY